MSLSKDQVALCLELRANGERWKVIAKKIGHENHNALRSEIARAKMLGFFACDRGGFSDIDTAMKSKAMRQYKKIKMRRYRGTK